MITLLQIIGTYSQTEIEEYYEDVKHRRKELQTEERLWKLGLTLSKHKGLSDELTARIEQNYAKGFELVSIDDEGQEWWVYKPSRSA